MKGNNLRDPVLVRKIAEKIAELTRKFPRKIRIMEVCGTHTHSIFHFGIRELLPENIELLSGPGCPVCVTPTEFIDEAIFFSQKPGMMITTFGDLMRVPGVQGSLAQAKGSGGKVQILYSPLDSLKLARENPRELVVFLGVGFETTAPLTTLAIQQAVTEGIKNFKILNGHKYVPPALQALVAQELQLDGFILPGHVSTIIGVQPYNFLAKEHKIPGAVAGFEPLEILHGILAIVEQLVGGYSEIVNVYGRVVKSAGNSRAVEMLEKYFTPVASKWRGLGVISDSGMALREEWQEFDLHVFDNHPMVQAVRCQMVELAEKKGGKLGSPCICGFILTGRKTPPDCPSFGKACQPESPLGACMVSSEGTCAAYYRYQRRGGKSLV